MIETIKNVWFGKRAAEVWGDFIGLFISAITAGYLTHSVLLGIAVYVAGAVSGIIVRLCIEIYQLKNRR